jgi:hypothetical protein
VDDRSGVENLIGDDVAYVWLGMGNETREWIIRLATCTRVVRDDCAIVAECPHDLA